MAIRHSVNRRVWQRVGRALIGIGLLLGLTTTYVWYLYADTRPHVPDSSDGRVYSLNTHGTFVYLTIAELARLYGLMAAGALCTATGIAIAFRIDHRIYRKC
jgi:hypothetical protein